MRHDAGYWDKYKIEQWSKVQSQRERTQEGFKKEGAQRWVAKDE